jgi:hypothetical protein
MAEPSSLRWVDLETARASRGLRLAVVTSVPSLWSDAARGMAAAKELDCLAVPFDPRDESVPRWTGCPNAPVALYADELPRTGWAEILALLDRQLARPVFERIEDDLAAAITPALRAHRDRIAQRWFALPPA